MTTPTQAQEVERLRMIIAAVRDWTLLQGDVVWYSTITTLHDFCQQSLDAAAAAQVGEPHKTHSVDFLEGIAEGKAATIERCAQVMDAIANKYRNTMSLDAVATAEEGAAAIRKLKDG